MNRERGHILVVILGIALLLFVIGFFRSTPGFYGTVNFKTLLRLPCGLTVNNPKFKSGEKVSFPLVVDGYIKECGWVPEGSSAGTVQVFDGVGNAVTKAMSLEIPADSTDLPYYFKATLIPVAAPTTDSGAILLRSTTGLMSSIEVAF